MGMFESKNEKLYTAKDTLQDVEPSTLTEFGQNVSDNLTVLGNRISSIMSGSSDDSWDDKVKTQITSAIEKIGTSVKEEQKTAEVVKGASSILSTLKSALEEYVLGYDSWETHVNSEPTEKTETYTEEGSTEPKTRYTQKYLDWKKEDATLRKTVPELEEQAETWMEQMKTYFKAYNFEKHEIDTTIYKENKNPLKFYGDLYKQYESEYVPQEEEENVVPAETETQPVEETTDPGTTGRKITLDKNKSYTGPEIYALLQVEDPENANIEYISQLKEEGYDIELDGDYIVKTNTYESESGETITVTDLFTYKDGQSYNIHEKKIESISGSVTILRDKEATINGKKYICSSSDGHNLWFGGDDQITVEDYYVVNNHSEDGSELNLAIFTDYERNDAVEIEGNYTNGTRYVVNQDMGEVSYSTTDNVYFDRICDLFVTDVTDVKYDVYVDENTGHLMERRTVDGIEAEPFDYGSTSSAKNNPINVTISFANEDGSGFDRSQTVTIIPTTNAGRMIVQDVIYNGTYSQGDIAAFNSISNYWDNIDGMFTNGSTFSNSFFKLEVNK